MISEVILIAGAGTLSDAAAGLADALGRPGARDGDGYDFSTGETAVFLSDNGYLDDGDVEFEKYPFVIDIEGRAPVSEPARRLFTTLARSTTWDLLHVGDDLRSVVEHRELAAA